MTMTPSEIAARAAEAVMRTIERNKRIVKAEIAEAIEKVLLTSQQPSYAMWSEDAAFRQMQRVLCGND